MSADDVFGLFLESRLAAGCSKTTIDWYRFMMRRYGNWLIETGHTIESVRLLQLQQYQASLRTRYAPSTVHQATTAIITFYHWLVEVELLAVDPTVKLKRPKVPEYIPPAVAREYVLHMLDSIRPVIWLDWRDKLIIRTLFSTGMRVGECAGLHLPDVHLDGHYFVVTGKGERQRFCPFGDDLTHPLWQWIYVQRPPCAYSNLFLSTRNGGAVRGGMTIPGLYDMLRRRCDAAALEWRSPHAYRHGFALDMLQSGASTRLVQKLLGHARLETTERYLQMSPQLVQGMFAEIWQELD